MRIAIGIPTTGSIKTWTVEYLVAMIAATEGEVNLFTKINCLIHDSRTDLVKDAKSINADYLFFLDSDVIAPIDTINKLLSHNKMIIGTNLNMRGLPLKSTVKFNGEIPKELFKCSAVATGCMLINMEVFDIIDKPYFWYEDLGDGFMGEDVWFCRQAERKGIEVWCDPTINVKHIGDYLY